VAKIATITTRAEHKEDTRLVLNIAQDYPARLRTSKITRLAEDKLELYSILTEVFYLSYH